MTVRIMVQINILFHSALRLQIEEKGGRVSDISQGHGDAYDMVEGNGGDPR